MSRTTRKGFTLIELLVVISIIAILLSIMMPVIQQVHGLVQFSSCSYNMRLLTMALNDYVMDNREHLPYTAGAGNPSTSAVTWGQPNGFGYLWDGEYILDHHMMFCPDAVVYTGWGSDPAAGRKRLIRDFKEKMARRDNPMRVDYCLGFWTQTGHEYPNSLDGSPTIENYEQTRKLWIADENGAFSAPYRLKCHDDWEYMPVATTEGFTTHIEDYLDEQPQSGGNGYYYPYNDRPMWGWWRYYGPKIP